ncbi:hypothetical protein BDR06DRAFT_974439 [Suillus hirtellus]|nr:hypothetical protein BDR06DRAFT_974439 [Suillus hirtellus]
MTVCIQERQPRKSQKGVQSPACLIVESGGEIVEVVTKPVTSPTGVWKMNQRSQPVVAKMTGSHWALKADSQGREGTYTFFLRIWDLDNCGTWSLKHNAFTSVSAPFQNVSKGEDSDGARVPERLRMWWNKGPKSVLPGDTGDQAHLRAED